MTTDKKREYMQKWRENNSEKLKKYQLTAKNKKKTRNYQRKEALPILSLPGEEFKEYKGRQISNLGRVFNRWGKQVGMGIAKGNGYHYIKNKKRARIVYELFKGPIPEGLVINHIDGDKCNDNIDNLEAITMGENNKHAYDTGLKQPLKKFSDEQCHQACKLIIEKYSNIEIESITGISKSTINDIRQRRTKLRISNLYFNENWHRQSEHFLFPKETIVLIFKDLKEAIPIKEISKKYNISTGQLYSIKNGKRWNALKYQVLKESCNE